MKQLGLYGSQVDAKKDRETAAKTCGTYGANMGRSRKKMFETLAHTADGKPSFCLWSGTNEMCMIKLVWSHIFFHVGGFKFVCVYFHQNWEDNLLWSSFLGIGWEVFF